MRLQQGSVCDSYTVSPCGGSKSSSGQTQAKIPDRAQRARHTVVLQGNPGGKERMAEGDNVGRTNARRMWEWVRCYALCRKRRATGVLEFDREVAALPDNLFELVMQCAFPLLQSWKSARKAS